MMSLQGDRNADESISNKERKLYILIMSIPCGKSELLLFEPRMAQVAIDRAKWVNVYPTTSLGGGADTIEFFVAGSEEEYLDLNDTSLYIRVKVTKSEDAKALTKADAVYLINMPISSLFRDVSIYFNSDVVEEQNNLYPYKAMINALLMSHDELKNTQLEAGGFYTHNAAEMKIGHEGLQGCRVVEYMGPIYADIFTQSKYLIPKVDLRVVLNRSTDLFAQVGAPQMDIKVTEAILSVRKVRVNPTVLNAHKEGLLSNNAIYPIQKSMLTTFTVGAGLNSHIEDNLFRGQLPKMIIIGLVNNSGFTGDIKKSPFNFQHFDLNYMSLSRDGDIVPGAALTPNFKQGIYVKEYMAMIQNLEFFNHNDYNGITKDMFISGHALFVFNLTPDLSMGGNCGQVYKTGNLRLELRFAVQLKESINVVLYAIRDGAIQITSAREIIKE